MHSKEYIASVVKEAVQNVTGIKSLNNEVSLVGKEIGIIPVDFLYIFKIIEEELEMPVCKVFENSTYEVMSVNNLAEAIYKLQIEMQL